MKPTVFSVCVLLSVAVLAGCNDSGPSYPIGDGGWQVVLDVGRIPDPRGEYPVFIEIDVQVINLTDGRRPVDGSILLFGTSGGSYENGLPEIQKGMEAGEAGSTLQIDQPGRYEVSAEFVEGSCTAVATFNVGL